jgi:hypothetical protein
MSLLHALQTWQLQPGAQPPVPATCLSATQACCSKAPQWQVCSHQCHGNAKSSTSREVWRDVRPEFVPLCWLCCRCCRTRSQVACRRPCCWPADGATVAEHAGMACERWDAPCDAVRTSRHSVTLRARRRHTQHGCAGAATSGTRHLAVRTSNKQDECLQVCHRAASCCISQPLPSMLHCCMQNKS